MITRRNFGKMAGAAFAVGMLKPGWAMAQSPANIPRDKTLIAPWDVNGPVFRNVGLANPFSVNIEDIRGSILNAFEALFYYNIQKDELTPWLGESYAYVDDYMGVVIKLRAGVEWSDGTPFTARDVAFTYNMLRDVGNTTKDLQYSSAVAQAVKEAVVVDDLTVRIDFTARNTRFANNLLLANVDVGFPMVPEHIWSTVEDKAAFTFFDLEKGWPVVTGPWRVTRFTDTQCFLDRRDDWWAAKTGFHPLPEVERFVGVPSGGADQMAQLIVTDQIDMANITGTDIIETIKATNSKLVTYDDNPPYGEINSWNPSFYFNHLSEKWADVRVRRAINHYIDRQQVIDNFAPGSLPSFGPFAKLETMVKVNEVIEPIAAKYGVGAYDPAKGDALLQEAGYAKNGSGMWEKDGVVLGGIIDGITPLNRVGPLVAQQLLNHGVDVTFRSTPETRAIMRDGAYDLLIFGHQTSDLDPYQTFQLYHSRNALPAGQPTMAVSRWSNPDYDKLVEEMAQYESADPKFIELGAKAMEIWMENMVEAPLLNWYARIVANTTYWQNWPDAENPYAPAPSHRLSGYFGYVLTQLKSTNA